jgi:protein TonB
MFLFLINAVSGLADGVVSAPPAEPPAATSAPLGDTTVSSVTITKRKEDKIAHSSIRCIVRTNGDLSDCQVVSEDPPGHGFGAAALKLSSRFHMKPAVRNGQPVEGIVTIPFKWVLPSESTARPADVTNASSPLP